MNYSYLILLPILALIALASSFDNERFLKQLEVANSLLVQEGTTINVLEHYQQITKELEHAYDIELVEERKQIYGSIKDQLPQLYYKMALIEINLNKEVLAISDLNKSLKFNPNNEPAKKRLIELYLERGDFKKVEELISENNSAILEQIKQWKIAFGRAQNLFTKKEYQKCIKELSDNVLTVSPLSLSALELHLKCSSGAFESNETLENLDQSNKLIIQDLSKLITLQPIQNLSWYNQISDFLLFTECQFEKSRSFTKNCLRIDNDYKECGTRSKFYTKFHDFLAVFEDYSITLGHYYISLENSNIKSDLQENFDYQGIKKFLFEEDVKVSKLEKKKLSSSIKTNYDYLIHRASVFSQEKSGKNTVNDLKFVKDLNKIACESFIQLKDLRHSKKYCSKIDPSENFLPTLIPQIDQLLKVKKFQEAKDILERINKNVRHTKLFAERNNIVEEYFHKQEQARQREWMNQQRQQQQQRQQYQQRHRAQPQKPAKDYYKILDIPKDADEKTIRKGYRTQTLKYHPDKYKGNDLTPDEIEHKMQDINQAYEVLSDPDLKARYDRGEDPNDPTSGQRQQQQQQHRQPFGGHSFNFQGNGFGSGFNFGSFGNQRGAR